MSTVSFLLGSTLILWMIRLRNTLEIETTPLFHIIIKISTTGTYVVSYLFLLPVIKCAVSINLGIDNDLKVLSIITLVVFFGFLYPLSTFFMTELSSCGNKTIAYLSFPNCFTFLNIFRLILPALVAHEQINYILIPSIALFLVLVVLLARSPIISWKFNKINQIFFTFLMWNIICSTIQIITQTEPSIYMYLIGGTAFVLSMDWIL